jgi:hypothetical protein
MGECMYIGWMDGWVNARKVECMGGLMQTNSGQSGYIEPTLHLYLYLPAAWSLQMPISPHLSLSCHHLSLRLLKLSKTPEHQLACQKLKIYLNA